MSGMFDPATFMEATIEGVLDTKRIPCPAGEWHGVVKDYQAKSGEIKKGERMGETWAALEVNWEIEDPGVQQVCQRDHVFSKQFIMLDLTEEGMLDMGKQKNIGLGKLLEATGLNTGKFSFPQLVGQRAMCKVGHRPDEKDPTVLYDEVNAVRKIG